jgi:hypothetical protein
VLGYVRLYICVVTGLGLILKVPVLVFFRSFSFDAGKNCWLDVADLL